MCTTQNYIRSKDKSMRITHHSRRVEFPDDWHKARAYFMNLQEQYDCIYKINEEPQLYESELAFYRERYTKTIELANEAYRIQRKTKRIISIKVMHGKKRSCPEELMIQIGNRHDTISREMFLACMNDYLKWLIKWDQSHGRHMHILNVSVSKNPPYHSILRRVWDYGDEKGMIRISQRKALEKAGVALKDPSEESSRFNHRKAAFDAESRKALFLICKRHKINVKEEPDIHTLRQSIEVKDAVLREEKASLEKLRQMVETEDLLSARESEINDIAKNAENPDLVGILPEYYYLMRIRNALYGPRSANVEKLSGQLLKEQEDLREEQLLFAEQEARLSKLQKEYMILRIGMVLSGYSVRNIC